MEPIPEKDFAWCTTEELAALLATTAAGQEIKPERFDKGYILEVDLDYPAELHDAHREYPLAPERLRCSAEEPSPYLEGLRDQYGVRASGSEKLVPNFHPKELYVVYWKNLNYYVSKGLRVTAIHRAVSFTESAWLRPYVELNTRLRHGAKSTQERDLFKLLNNALYGKTIENLKNRSDIILTRSAEEFTRQSDRPHCRNAKLFTATLGAVDLRKTKVMINRPFSAGFVVLDVSKLLMNKAHDYFKHRYQEAAQLLYTDTDSLIYHIQIPNLFGDLYDTGRTSSTSATCLQRLHTSTCNG